MAEKQINKEISEKLKSFMNAGTVRVFECGDQRPEHIEERPVFGLLPEGLTTYIMAGLNGEDFTVSIGEPSKDYVLDTENHRFFKQMEERFRSVRPDMTLFVIDPDVVMGRYAVDTESDRSLAKSMYLHVAEKLSAVSALGKTPISEQDVPQVIDAAINSSNAFSSTNPINVTHDNLSGERNVSLVVGDNPDTLVDDMFHWIPGVKERMEQEGVSRRQLMQFTIYHEFGHALDPAHKGGMDKIVVQNTVEQQLARHRTECLADAHAVLQLARDYGQTDISLLIGDVRIENTLNAVKRYSQQESTYALENKLDKLADENKAVKSGDSAEIAEIKKMQTDSERYAQVEKAGASLAYFTTEVVDAAIEVAKVKLADGSLMKMSDLEVLDLADELSQKHGLTKEEMTKFRMDVVDNKPNPTVDRIKSRAEQAFDRMPISREKMAELYAAKDKKKADKREQEVDALLGVIKEPTKPEVTVEQLMKAKEKVEKIIDWKASVFDKIVEKGGDKDALIETLTEEKEAVRKASLKDEIGKEKLEILNQNFIAEGPTVLEKAKANQSVFKQIQALPEHKNLPRGSSGLAHFVNFELSAMDKMLSALNRVMVKDESAMTIDEQMDELKKDKRDFNKVLVSEKAAQESAAAVIRNPNVQKKLEEVPTIKKLLEGKAQGKHPDWMTEFQMNFGSMKKEKAEELIQAVSADKYRLIQDVTASNVLMQAVQRYKPQVFKNISAYAQDYSEQMKKKQAEKPQIDFKKLATIKAPSSSR